MIAAYHIRNKNLLVGRLHKNGSLEVLVKISLKYCIIFKISILDHIVLKGCVLYTGASYTRKITVNSWLQNHMLQGPNPLNDHEGQSLSYRDDTSYLLQIKKKICSVMYFFLSNVF